MAATFILLESRVRTTTVVFSSTFLLADDVLKCVVAEFTPDIAYGLAIESADAVDVGVVFIRWSIGLACRAGWRRVPARLYRFIPFIHPPWRCLNRFGSFGCCGVGL